MKTNDDGGGFILPEPYATYLKENGGKVIGPVTRTFTIPETLTREDLQLCGHPRSAIRGKGLTHYCALCEEGKC